MAPLWINWNFWDVKLSFLKRGVLKTRLDTNYISYIQASYLIIMLYVECDLQRSMVNFQIQSDAENHFVYLSMPCWRSLLVLQPFCCISYSFVLCQGLTPPLTLPRLTPESSACIFLPSGPSEPRVSHDWAPTYPTALRTTPNEPRFLPTLPQRSHESCRISLIRLDSGLGPKNFKLFKVFGAISRSAKNHQKSSRLTTNLLRFTPNHPDSVCYDSPWLTIRSSFGCRFGNV